MNKDKQFQTPLKLQNPNPINNHSIKQKLTVNELKHPKLGNLFRLKLLSEYRNLFVEPHKNHKTENPISNHLN